jgi:hypothetical protein
MLNSDIVIKAAIDSLTSHPMHHLEIGLRRPVWLLLGDSLPGEGIKNISRKKRYILSVMCAEYVRDIYTECFQHRSDIINFYSEAIEILSLYWDEQKTLEEVQVFADIFYKVLQESGRIDNLKFESLEDRKNYKRATFAMDSIWECLRVSLYDEPFNNQIETNVKDTDTDIVDVYDADAAYWAADTYSGSMWDLATLDRERRLKFWTWWLEEAVPQVLKM